MPIPPDHQMVGPAVGAPFDEVECPDDSAKAAGADIRRVAATLLGNDAYVLARWVNGVDDGGSYPADITFTGTITLVFTIIGIASIGDLEVVNESQFYDDVTLFESDLILDEGDVKVGTGDYTYDPPRALERVVKSQGKYQSINWDDSAVDDNRAGHTQNGATPMGAIGDDHWLEFDVDVPDGATITGATVRVEPPGSHIGVPTIPPRIRLVYQNVTGAAGYQTIGTASDTVTGSIAAYEAGHDVVLSGQSFSYNEALHKLVIRIQGEHGTNSLNGLIALPPRIAFTADKLTP